MNPLNPDIVVTDAPPVMEARRWLDGVVFPPERPLLNVSQAAPVDPPPEPLRQAMADAVLNTPTTHLYGPVLGLPDLREELARQWSTAYGGEIGARHVAITAGCNQAFATTLSTLATKGDEVILPTPWYFNHKMWLDMQGIKAVPLATGDGLIPDVDAARALISDRTRAIVLVTPNNPGGAEYPAATLEGFFDLCAEQKIALIVDETYRDFDSRTGAPHGLFTRPNWDETLIHLYSFSKAFRLTGHRVGAMVCSPDRLFQAEKFLDTVAICAPQLGQIAALWGLQNLGGWVAEQRAEILSRKNAMSAQMQRLSGWELLGCGAYFAYVRHPDPRPSPVFAQAMVSEAGVLALPGTMFRPETDPRGARELRIAFANIGVPQITELADRLSAYR